VASDSDVETTTYHLRKGVKIMPVAKKAPAKKAPAKKK